MTQHARTSEPSQHGINLATQALINRMERIGATSFTNQDCSNLAQYIIAHYLIGADTQEDA